MKIIRSYADLHELHLRLYKFDIYRKSETYKTSLPQWDVDQNNRTTNMINRYNRKCGRTFVNFVMILVFTAYLVEYFNSGGTVAGAGLKELTELIVYTGSGAITGKIFALVYARWRLIKFVQRLL